MCVCVCGGGLAGGFGGKGSKYVDVHTTIQTAEDPISATASPALHVTLRGLQEHTVVTTVSFYLYEA